MRSGEIRCHHLSISTVRDDDLEPQYYVGMLQDVTELRQAEQAVNFMAQHDSLTGLANRSMLMEQLERHLALAKRHGRGVALLYLDLDGFKSINDVLGHSAGDRYICMIADRLRSAMRAEELLARLGVLHQQHAGVGPSHLQRVAQTHGHHFMTPGQLGQVFFPAG